MKVTVYNAEPEFLGQIPNLIRAYFLGGHAGEGRDKHRNCVGFGINQSLMAAVWGGPKHIRIQFSQRAGAEVPSS